MFLTLKAGEALGEFLTRCSGDAALLAAFPEEKKRVEALTALFAKRSSAEQKAIVSPIEIKGVDAATRTFEGLAATWKRDLGDDIIHKGAFKATLKDWRDTGRVMPLIDQHNYGSVRAAVGKLLDARETDAGLYTKWQVLDSNDGNEVMARLRGGMVDSLSIGYAPIKWEIEKDDSAMFGELRHLKQVELREVSLVLFPMNPTARIDVASVKSACAGLDSKALRALAGHIGNLLKNVGTDDVVVADSPTDAGATQEAAEAPDPAAPPAEEGKSYVFAEALLQRTRRLLTDPKTITALAPKE